MVQSEGLSVARRMRDMQPMNPICWHLILRLQDRRVLVPTVATRRLLAAVVAAVGRSFDVFLFHAPDTHLHVVVACERAPAGRLASSLASSLRRQLGLRSPFLPTEFVPVLKQSHLASLPAYVLGNAEHHGVAVDPLHEASNLPDLLGLRVIAQYTIPLLRQKLPRLGREDLLPHLGVETLTPGNDLQYLADAAAAAIGRAELDDRGPLTIDARTAAIELARKTGVSSERIASLLAMSTRNVRRLSARKADPPPVRAIGLQIGLRQRLAVSPKAGGG